MDDTGYEYFDCACFSMAHTIRFIYFEDGDPPDLYAEMFISRDAGLFTRIWQAIKHVCNRPVRFGCWALKPEDVARLSNYVAGFEMAYDHWVNKQSVREHGDVQ